MTDKKNEGKRREKKKKKGYQLIGRPYMDVGRPKGPKTKLLLNLNLMCEVG